MCLRIGVWSLPYGLCVDVYHKQAWCEGVVFDQENGSEERLIFLPDSGSEIKIGIDMVRITQDWDVTTRDWKLRGKWLFLDLVEELERNQEEPLRVSVKEMWLAVQGKVKDWSCSVKPLLSKLVSETFKELVEDKTVLDVNLDADLANSQVTTVGISNIIGSIANCESTDFEAHLVNFDPDLANSAQIDLISIGSINNSESTDFVADLVNFHGNERNLINPDAVGVTSSGAITRGSNTTDFNKVDQKPTKSRGKKASKNWQVADPKIIGGAKYCPNAVIKYAVNGTNPHDPTVVDIRKHLSYLGWKIEYIRDNKHLDVLRFRYTSPDGKRYFSLVQLCQYLRESTMEIQEEDESKSSTMEIQEDESKSSVASDTNVCPQVKGISSNDIFVVEPEHCPEAVVFWYLHGLDKKRRKEEDIKPSYMTLKVKKHLSFLRWVFWYAEKGRKRELRYTSQSGTTYYSLRTACKACIDGGQIPEWLAYKEKLSSSTANAKLQESFVPSNAKQSSSIPQSNNRKRKDNLSIDEHASNKKPKTGDDPKGNQPTRVLRSRKSVRQEVLHSQPTPVLRSSQSMRQEVLLCQPIPVLQSSTSVRQEVLPSLPYRNPRTVLSWLIENNAVLPEDKVHYRGRNGGPSLATGKITRDGIECNCCHKLFTLTGFEGHAGSTNHRPAANIILEDGRSLLDCQNQVGYDRKTRSITRKKPQGMNGNCDQDDNDSICSVCKCEGDLILCDQCPSSFHKSCLGLKDVPDGDWYCPLCCCGICHQSKVTEGSEHSADNSVHTCDQCEQKYHAGCLRSRGVVELDSLLQDKWFCSSNCEKIYSGLHELLGRPIPVSVTNLKWTLVKATESDTDSKKYSKLNVALEVMHECFQPCKDAYTGRDLVEDVIFCSRSELNRLNFKGFYTVLLENNEELISVANVRVYGNKVAEVPLVATRFKFRGLGMCRMLMNELEKKLKELGVERLVLPAVPTVLNTWTTSFGFSKMTDSERIQLLNYIFLDFQSTIMCQKLLVKSPSPDSSQGSLTTVADDVPRSSNEMEFEWSNHKSEVLQVEHIEESGVVNQCPIECS